MEYTDSRNIYRLKPWIHESQIEHDGLYRNPSEGAGKLFETFLKNRYIRNSDDHPLKILSANPSEWAREYLRKHPEHIDYYWLCTNQAHWARKILRKNPSKIDWYSLVKNPADWVEHFVLWKIKVSGKTFAWNFSNLFENPAEWAGKFVKENAMKPVWYLLCENPGEWAGVMMNENLDKISWNRLCRNPAEWAREILMKNPGKIDDQELKMNPAKWAWDLLNSRKNADDVVYQHWNRDMIYHHPCAWVVEELEKNVGGINWHNWHPFSKNPHIFEYDYQFLRERCWNTFGEELMQVCFHPRNLSKFSDWGYDSGLEEEFEDEE